MAQTHEGAIKINAKHLGISVEEYKCKVSAGLKHCQICRQWISNDLFTKDSSRFDGLCSACAKCRSASSKSRRKKIPRVSKKGLRFVPVRCGDKKQARYRVNQLIKIGKLKNPNLICCHDCGHIGDDKRHEYDHFEGYTAEKQEIVQAVCTKCHSKRSFSRGEIKRKERCKNGKFKNSLV